MNDSNFSAKLKKNSFLFLEIFFALLTAILIWRFSRASAFWGDEFHSLVLLFSFDPLAYATGHTGEGTVAPLFFFVQKAFLESSALGSYLGVSQLTWLRLVGLLPAWLMMVVFVRLSRWEKISWLNVLFSTAVFVGVAISTTMIGYSWQARPYALWGFLTAWHSYNLWMLLLHPEHKPKLQWWMLALSGTLLVLLTPFGILQLFCSLGLLVTGGWNRAWMKKLLFPAALALVLLVYTLFIGRNVSGYLFKWPGLAGFPALVAGHLRWWLVAILLVVGVLGSLSRRDQFKIVLLFASVLTAIGLQVILFYRRQSPAGFDLSNRYFLYLLPMLLVPGLLLLRKIAAEKMHLSLRLALLVLAGFIFLHSGWKIRNNPAIVQFVDAYGQQKESIAPYLAEAGDRCLCLESPQAIQQTNLWLILRDQALSGHCASYLSFDGQKLGTTELGVYPDTFFCKSI